MTDTIDLLKDKEVQARFKALPINQQLGYAWRTKWLTSAHDHQILPPGDWAIWLLLGGRGAGRVLASGTANAPESALPQ